MHVTLEVVDLIKLYNFYIKIIFIRRCIENNIIFFKVEPCHATFSRKNSTDGSDVTRLFTLKLLLSLVDLAALMHVTRQRDFIARRGIGVTKRVKNKNKC
jgi:hypothetical protein